MGLFLSPETVAKAESAARARGESLDDFVEHAVKVALEEHHAFVAAMEEADRDLEEGRTHSWEEVRAWLDEALSRARLEIARRAGTA